MNKEYKIVSLFIASIIIFLNQGVNIVSAESLGLACKKNPLTEFDRIFQQVSSRSYGDFQNLDLNVHPNLESLQKLVTYSDKDSAASSQNGVINLFNESGIIYTGDISAGIDKSSFINILGLDGDNGILISTNTQELSAWMYPGSPGENAMDEVPIYNPDIIRVEYHIINEDGELIQINNGNGYENGYSKENLSIIKNNVSKVLTTVSGGNQTIASLTQDRLAGGTKINSITQQLVHFTVKNDLQGVDLDLERIGAWNKQEVETYYQIILSLGYALSKVDKEFHLVLPPLVGTLNNGFSFSKLNTAPYKDLIDEYIIMAYDYMYDSDEIGVPIQPLDWLGQVIDYTKDSFPDTSKISMGMNSYGYVWDESSSRVISNKTYSQLKNLPGFSTAKRDNDSGELFWNEGGRYYRAVDERGLNIKKSYILSKGIDKISVWHLGGNKWFSRRAQQYANENNFGSIKEFSIFTDSYIYECRVISTPLPKNALQKIDLSINIFQEKVLSLPKQGQEKIYTLLLSYKDGLYIKNKSPQQKMILDYLYAKLGYIFS